jgi:hypothetical protein
MVAPLIKMKIINNISYKLWMERWVDLGEINNCCYGPYTKDVFGFMNDLVNYFGLDMSKSQLFGLDSIFKK